MVRYMGYYLKIEIVKKSIKMSNRKEYPDHNGRELVNLAM